MQKTQKYTYQNAIQINMFLSINNKLRGKRSDKMHLNVFVYIINIFAKAYKLYAYEKSLLLKEIRLHLTCECVRYENA